MSRLKTMTARTGTRIGLVLLTIVLGGAAVRPAAQTTPAGHQPPRLIVLLVVDQFRGDYVETYGRHWTAGLRRLLDRGAYFPQAAYPYVTTVTCAGHTTIGTGALPRTHGMVGNSFYDAALGRIEPCTEDPSATAMIFEGPPSAEHQGPGYLRVPTLADELRRTAARPPAIVSLSLKADAAIGMAGHGGAGTEVVWKDGNGSWATSSAYTTTLWPEVVEYAKAHPITAAYGQVWTKMLPADAYLGQDDALGEAAPAPWTRTFPHPLESRSGKPDTGFVNLWSRSPFSDAYLEDFAASLVEARRMGQGDGTDLLAVSFSALDLVGHQFGPNSHEVQDVLAHLDVTIGRLLDTLDRRVGPDRYVVALSADHGVGTIPEQVTDAEAGRLSVADLARRVDAALAPSLGDGTHLAGRPGAELNFNFLPGVYDRIRTNPDVRRAVETALLSAPGVAKVFWSDQLAGSGATSDPALQAARLGYMAGRSGDLLVLPRPRWIATGSGTTHGTYNDYDRRVPVIFFGASIKTGVDMTPATPADIAPTLASLAGITLSHADGHVLADAIVR